MEDKAHNELVKQFPKPDVPALNVSELDGSSLFKIKVSRL